MVRFRRLWRTVDFHSRMFIPSRRGFYFKEFAMDIYVVAGTIIGIVITASVILGIIGQR